MEPLVTRFMHSYTEVSQKHHSHAPHWSREYRKYWSCYMPRRSGDSRKTWVVACCFHIEQRRSCRIAGLVCRRVYRLSRGNLRSGWYRCVHDMYGPNGLNHSRSTGPSSPAYVAAVDHEGIFSETPSSSSPKRSDAKYFERARNTWKHGEGCTDWIRDRRNENLITGRS